MNIKFVETFVLAARLGSFRRTAEQLHTTQAAVSARIQSLEDELGAALFDRGGRQLQLTAKARELLPMAERLVAMAIEFEGCAKDPAAHAGRVRLGIIDTAANAFLAPFLRLVESRFPKVEIDLQAATSHRIVQRMVNGDIEMGITLVGSEPPGSLHRRMISLACHWVAAPGYVPNGVALEVRDLAAHAILSFAHGSDPHLQIEAFFDGVGGPRRLYSSSSLATTLGLARQGMGIALLPVALLQQELQTGCLQVLNAPTPFRSLDIQLSYLPGRRSRLLAALADTAVEAAHTYCASLPADAAWVAPS